jgi:hypothetical protein
MMLVNCWSALRTILRSWCLQTVGCRFALDGPCGSLRKAVAPDQCSRVPVGLCEKRRHWVPVGPCRSRLFPEMLCLSKNASPFSVLGSLWDLSEKRLLWSLLGSSGPFGTFRKAVAVGPCGCQPCKVCLTSCAVKNPCSLLLFARSVFHAVSWNFPRVGETFITVSVVVAGS